VLSKAFGAKESENNRKPRGILFINDFLGINWIAAVENGRRGEDAFRPVFDSVYSRALLNMTW